MAEYIDCRNCKSPSCEGCNMYILEKMLHGGAFNSMMDNHRTIIPAADVALVVRAKWIDGADSFGAKRGRYRVCSRCNICIPCVTEVPKSHWQYCPSCGAKMTEE